jgi:hypothetical protein
MGPKVLETWINETL